MWYRIEIDNRIYAGFYAFDNRRKKEITVDNNLKGQIEKMCPKLKFNLDGCWVNFEYLPTGDGSNCPDFKQFNETYCDLYDDVKFEKFIDDSVNIIEKMISEQY